MNKVTRIIALPLLSAGILGGALGVAGTAAAAVGTSTGGHSVTASQETQSHNPTHNTWRNRHHDNTNVYWRR